MSSGEKDHLANSENKNTSTNIWTGQYPNSYTTEDLKMEDIPLSTSKAREGIAEGIYTGWDDPRLGTIRAIARRGIQAEAIRKLMTEIGVKMADTKISWKKIYGLNRTFLEEKANRYFMVEHPEPIKIEGIPESELKTVERPLHPDHLDRGMRKLPFDGQVYLEEKDIPSHPKQVIRLMDAVNITFLNGKAQYHSSVLMRPAKPGPE